MQQTIPTRLLISLIFIFPLLGGCSSLSGTQEDRVQFQQGYGTAQHLFIEGRVTQARRSSPITTHNSAARNLLQNTRLFINRERKNETIGIDFDELRWQVTTDEEGYFVIEQSDIYPPLSAGWHTVSADREDTEHTGELLIVPQHNTVGIISDVDDTILKTDVSSKLQMLKNTFLLNASQRQAMPGTAALLSEILAENPEPEAAPMFYLSASPRQLHASLSEFLQLNDFPRGVLVTKLLSDESSSDPWFDQIAYKTRKIEEILARVPHVRFLLLGDNSENDPEIFSAINQRFPDRIEALWIRQTTERPACEGIQVLPLPHTAETLIVEYRGMCNVAEDG